MLRNSPFAAFCSNHLGTVKISIPSNLDISMYETNDSKYSFFLREKILKMGYKCLFFSVLPLLSHNCFLDFVILRSWLLPIQWYFFWFLDISICCQFHLFGTYLWLSIISYHLCLHIGLICSVWILSSLKAEISSVSLYLNIKHTT